MRKILILIIVAAVLSNCRKDENNMNNNKGGIQIKGKISQVKKSSNSLADAKKILVFGGTAAGGPPALSFVDIVNGSFLADCRIGTAVAMVFLDENNKYIGTLSTQGLNLLPLCSMPEGDSSTIDLSTLTLEGSTVIPSHDPFGNEIIISEADINSLKEVDGYFETLSKNIDADNNGELDLLSDKQIYIKSSFAIMAGKYGINNTGAVISDTALNSIQYNTYITGGLGFTEPDTAFLAGPEGNPYEDIQFGHLQDIDNNGHGFSTGFYIGNSAFKKGIYTLTLDEQPYTISFSNIDASYNLVFATPTLNTDGEGKLVSIDLKYQHADYVEVNPENIMTDLIIELNDTLKNRLFNSPRIISKNTINIGSYVTGLDSYTLETPLNISALEYIDIVYTDLLGNLYFIQWRK